MKALCSSSGFNCFYGSLLSVQPRARSLQRRLLRSMVLWQLGRELLPPHLPQAQVLGQWVRSESSPRELQGAAEGPS